MAVTIKRIYKTPEKDDGKRILVDRLWPRGLTKEKAQVDIWLKEIAPSTGLRKWFSHDTEKWEEFKVRYLKELENNEEAVAKLKDEINIEKVTLLYGAKDEEHNEATVLKKFIENV